MSKKDIFGDSLETPTSSFADLFEQSLGTQKIKTGDRLKGEVLSIGKSEVFVSTGTPTDGALPLREVLDKDQKLTVKVGDVIEVQVLRVREGEILLKMADSLSGGAELDSLEDAFDMELPVEGRVLEAVKGGFRVMVMGKKAFCPISQIDSKFVQDPQAYLNQKYEFIITQFEDKGRNIVVSRRKLLDLQQAEQEGIFLQDAKPGDLLSGEVMKLEKFGAFVKLKDGPQGLIPISEIAWGRISHPSEVLREGQEVRVKLLKTEEVDGKLRIALSLKQAGGDGDPWMSVLQKFPQGSVHKGTIEKKETYGFFISLAPGITGLLPKSKMKDSVEGHNLEAKKKGDSLEVRVDQVNFEDKRISLGLPTEDEPGYELPTDSGKSLGTFADLFKNIKGK